MKPGNGWGHGPAVQVVPAGYLHAGEVMRTFDVSRDGKRFLLIKQNTRPSIILVQNWHDETEASGATRQTLLGSDVLDIDGL